MFLNKIRPCRGSRHAPKRVGRGIGSGLGKTGGRGHKGFKSRSGASVKPGFEGGQMPLQRRLPKFGFSSSRKEKYTAEVRLSELATINAEVIDLAVLAMTNVISPRIRKARLILSGFINKAVVIRGIEVTKGARNAIKEAGGRVEQ